ncbi:MAG: shikimate kinase [Chloroflexota bacterium]
MSTIPQYPQSIALIGLSGTGKSTVGQVLAERLGWSLLDTDATIVEQTGRSAAEIFAENGEAVFRDLETQVLANIFAHTPCIVATGGGIVLRETNRTLLQQNSYIVWLDAPIETLIARLQAHDEERPLLQRNDPSTQLAQLQSERAALYQTIADIRIDTGEKTTTEICDSILQAANLT